MKYRTRTRTKTSKNHRYKTRKNIKNKTNKRFRQKKYLKKTRRNKTKIQKGGMKTFNYALYGNFNDSVKSKMTNVMDYINDYVKSTGNFKSFWREDPHITIFYGPPEQYKDDTTAQEQEKKTKTAICNSLLNQNGLDFCKEFNGLLPEITYKGVSHFKRYPYNDKTQKPFYIIKFEFEAPELTNMQIYLRDMFPSVNEQMLKDESIYNDGTRAYPPTNWAHSTITFVENIDNETQVKEIQDKAEQMLADMGIKPGDTIKINNISMTSCYTDTPVKLW
jgi:hypothetical protein